jgi:hypothetical protein
LAAGRADDWRRILCWALALGRVLIKADLVSDGTNVRFAPVSSTDRFAEYGITGGFFLVTQFLVFGIVFPSIWTGGADTLKQLQTIVRNNSVIVPALQNLTIALALLISIFLIGLVLDLIGSPLALVEAKVVKNGLMKNKEWIDELMKSDLHYYAHEYDLFLKDFEEAPAWTNL